MAGVYGEGYTVTLTSFSIFSTRGRQALGNETSVTVFPERVWECGEGVQCPNERKPIFFMGASLAEFPARRDSDRADGRYGRGAATGSGTRLRGAASCARTEHMFCADAARAMSSSNFSGTGRGRR